MSSVTTSNSLLTNKAPISNTSRLAFGVEIEIFVKPRDNLEGTAFRACLEDHGWEDYVESNPDSQGFAESLETRSNRDAVRAAIAVALSEGGVDAWAPGFDDMPSYERWSVYNEQLSEPPAYWGIELVSRVLHSEDDWQAELDKIFDILETHCEVKTTHSCGTHVHVSPGQGQRFSDDQLRAVCKGLTYFEQPLLAILPGNRKDNKYCLSNILQPPAEFGPEFELQSAWQSIPTNSWAPVLEILQKINRGNLESIFGGLGKCSAWNFVRCLIEESSGTIECRRPPGIESAQQAKHWTGLVLGLFAESMSIDWSVEDERIKSRHDHPSVDELKEFASRGLERLGTTCNSALVNEWMAEDRSRAITDEEIEQMQDEWVRENLRMRLEWRAKGLRSRDLTLNWEDSQWEEKKSCRGSESTSTNRPDWDHDSSWGSASPKSEDNSSWSCSTDWPSNDCAQEADNSTAWENMEEPGTSTDCSKIIFDWELEPATAQDHTSSKADW